MHDHDSPRHPAAAGAEHTLPPDEAVLADPLKPVRALKRRVQATVFLAILLSELFYLFVLQRTPGELLPGLIGSVAIAAGAIEGAFRQIFKLRKRAAYPVEIALEVGAADELSAACGRALEVAQRQFAVRAAFLALTGAGGPPAVQAAAGLTHEEAQAVLQARAREAWAAMATQAPVQCGEPEPAIRGIDSGERLVLVPVVAVNRTTGLLGLVGGRRNADLKEFELLRNVGLGLGLSLENIRQKQDLGEKESRLRTVITSAPIVLFAVDRNGVFTLSEGKGLETLGLKPSQVVGLSIFDVYSGAPQILENIKRALDGDCFTSIVDVSGLVWETWYSPTRGQNGDVSGVIGVAADITERVRAEDAVRASESRFRALIENSSDGITLIAADGTIVEAGPSTSRLLGYCPSELVGTNVFSLAHPDDREQAAAVLATILGEPGKSAAVCLRFQHKDGSWIWLEGTGTNLFHEPSVQAVVWNYRDVTERKHAEDALRASESRFRALIENAADAIFSIGLDDRFISANAAVEGIIGYTREELLGMDVARVIAPEHKDLADRMAALKQEEGGRTAYEIDLIAKDGRRVPVEVSSWLVHEGDGQGVLHGIARDITERRLAEDAIRESEELYRTLVETSPDAVLLTAPDGTIMKANRMNVELLGFADGADTVGRNAIDFIAEEDRGRVREHVRRAAKGGVVPNIEYTLVRQDGSRIPIELSVSALRNGGGNAKAFISVARDITDRRRAEAALRESEERFRELFDNATDIVYTHDLAGQFLSINRAAERIMGYTAEEAVGTSIARIVAPEHLQMAAEMIRRKVTDGGRTTYELDVITKDGRRVPLEVSTRIVYQDGRPAAVQGIARDITERRRAEQALRGREAILEAVSFAASHFLVSGVDEVSGIQEVLRRLGEAAGVSRVYTFEIVNRTEDEAVISMRHEWVAPGITVQIDNPDMAGFPMRELGFGRWVEAMSRGEPVYGHVREFPEAEEEVLGPQDILSIACVPVFVAGQWWGFIGFDECAAEREWPAVEVEALRTAADLLGAAIQRRRSEDALRESEEKYRELVENTNEVIYTLDSAGVVTYVSPVVEQVGGFAPAEIIGQSFVPLVHPEDMPGLMESFQRTLGGQMEPSEYRMKTKFGDYRWVRSSSRPMYEDGQVVGLRGLLVDITERRRAEDALRAVAEGTASASGDEFFRSLVKHLASAVETKYAFIGQLTSEEPATVNTLVVWTGDGFAENFEYTLAGTPCETVVGATPCLYQRDVQQRFPEDGLLVEMGIESYMGAPLLDSAGHALGILAVMDDKPMEIAPSASSMVSIFAARAGAELERRRAEEALRQSEERYRNVVETARDVIYTLAPDGTLASLNPAFEAVTGWACADWTDRSFAPLIHPDDLNTAIDTFRRVLAGDTVFYELQILKKSGDYLVGEFTSTPLIEKGQITGALGFARDITERKKAEKMIRQLAYHDALTGLPNRALFEDRLRVALAQAHRSRQQVAVMFLDLDRFKLVNDTLGHGDGDKLLQEVARDLGELVREGDTVARVGGDEFTLLLAGINQPEDAIEVAERILDRLKQPRLLGGQEFRVTTSIGVTIYPADGMDPEALLRNADTAMYRAKEQGRDNYQCYTPAMNANIMERLDLERDLRRALERQEFTVHYQPLADVATGRVTGAEALLRWQRPGRGLALPDEFIPMAEETGMILPLGEWVLRTACGQNKAWQDAGYPPVRVAVNLSARQLQDERLAATVAGILAETGLAPEYLQLEITESAVMTNVEFIIQTLNELRAMGVGISVDDFGTGYSSLSYLKRFPIDGVKIDRSFVRDLATDPNDAAIVTTIIAMARSLNLKVIAEGVETEEQLAFLRRRSCDEYQGFLLGKAIPVNGFGKLLGKAAQHRAKVVRLKSA